MINLVGFARGADDDVRADARVFVDDGVVDARVVADADGRAAVGGVVFDRRGGFVVVVPEQHGAMQRHAVAEDAADADDRLADLREVHDATVGNDRVIDQRTVHLRGGQEAWARINRRGHVEEIEARQIGGDIQIRLEERADRPDVLPVTLENMRRNAVRLNRLRDDVFAEIGLRVVEQLREHAAVENVNAHRREEIFVRADDAEFLVQFRRQSQPVEHRWVLRLFHETRDAPFGIDLHDPQCLRVFAHDRDGRDRELRLRLVVLLDDGPEIHPVELIAAQDDHIVEIVVVKVDEIFPHRVRRALIPRGVGQRLFRGEDFHEAAGEMIKLIGLRNVPMKGRGVELREDVHALEPGVDAVGDGDVHEPVFAGERHGGFGAVFGEWIQARARAAAHDDAHDVAGGRCLSFRHGVGHNSCFTL